MNNESDITPEFQPPNIESSVPPEETSTDIYREIDRALELRQTVQSLLDEQQQLIRELRALEPGQAGANEKEVRLARINDVLSLMSDVNLDFPD